jgi:hypothetical protein
LVYAHVSANRKDEGHTITTADLVVACAPLTRPLA